MRFRLDDRPSLEVGRALTIDFEARFDGDLLTNVGGTDVDRGGWTGRRIGVSGRLLNRVGFEVSRELATDGQAWRDAFVELDAHRAARVRGGRFKVPFSEERLRAIGDLDFIARSMASRHLAPGRDVGAMVSGRLAGRTLAYQVGWFNGAPPDETITLIAREDSMWAARILVRPWSNVKQGAWWNDVRLGASTTRGRIEPGLADGRLTTVGERVLALHPVFVEGHRSRQGLEVQWTPGPVRVNAEWMRMADSRDRQALDGSDLPALVSRGWFVSGTWRVVSRKPAADARWRPIWVRSLELAARVEELSIGDAAAADAVVHPRAELLPLTGARLWTVGINWAWHQWVRMQVNAVHETRLGSARTDFVSAAAPDGHWTGVVRLQFDM